MSEEDELYDPTVYFAEVNAKVQPRAIIEFSVVSLLAAVACGLIWGFVALATAHTFLYLSIFLGGGIGLLAGIFMKERQSLFFPTWGMVMAGLGFLLGNYFVYMHFVLREYEVFGETQMGILDLMRYYLLDVGTQFFGIFWQDLPDVYPGWNLLCFAVMIMAVWIFSYRSLLKDRNSEHPFRMMKNWFD